ncbi:Serine/threonine-protein kinase PknB [Anatilimnocola aggregata]|uniref:Serine/threonine-protein kinase PknB n=1 Tax=Anatilimnocola aggregata TaxID=2528021 RepID=A0A517YKA8_9BACT|nr:serine/threonine-protein kinase [Anatilimnocola aggregata]QDU30659.1 Serine/threonine-protein kinase PknB [Anatilimnocola aggregata]
MLISCPDRGELAQFSFGHLTEASAEEFATHVDSCENCRTLLEAISSTPDPLAAALRRPAELPFAGEAALQQALPRLLACTHEPPTAASLNSSPSATDSWSALKTVRDYEILEKIGEGGMGAVYKARHSRLKKIVALKILPRDRVIGADSIARFEREMEAVGKLEHPHLVRAMDAGEADGMHFLVMEFVAGSDLSQLVKAQGPLAIADACELIRQSAAGLQHVHEQGLVHRDIKPSNLMLSPSGNVKILDLGLALLSGDGSPGGRELTTTGQMMGTLDYMAPEQGGDTHHVDIRADIYSLGASLYKLLTGVAPFGDRKFDTPVKKLMALAVQEPLPIRDRRPEIPAPLAAVVTKMLAKEPKDRYATPAAVAAALAPFTAGSNLVALAAQAAGTGIKTNKEDTYSSLKSASVDTLAPISSPSPTRPRAPLTRVKTIALAAAALLAAIVFFVQTPHGAVKVTINDPSISVKFDKTGAIVEGIDPKPIDLKFGEQGIVIKRGDAEFITTQFKLEKKGETILDIQLLPGEVKVVYDGKLIESKPLPAPVAPAIVKMPAIPANVDDPSALTKVEVTPPLNPAAMVLTPAKLPGVKSWTIEPLLGRRECLQTEFSPDDQWLAAAYSGGVIRIFDTKTRQLRNMFSTPGTVTEDYFCWSPKGDSIATCGSDGEGNAEVHVWDAVTGKRIKTLSAAIPAPTCIHWHPDGDLIATCNNNSGVIGIWSTVTGKLHKELRHDGTIGMVRWSPDGKFLASGEISRSVHKNARAAIWDSKTLIVFVTPQWSDKLANETSNNTLAWSPDSSQLAVGVKASKWEGVRIWNVNKGQDVQNIKTNGWERTVSCAWSSDSKQLAVRSQIGLELYDLATSTVRQKFDHVSSVIERPAWSHTGGLLVDGGSLAIAWRKPGDGKTFAKTEWCPEGALNPGNVFWSRNGNSFDPTQPVSVGNTQFSYYERYGSHPGDSSPDQKWKAHPKKNQLDWVDQATGAKETIPLPDVTGNNIFFAPNSQFAAISEKDKRRFVHIFDIRSKQVIHRLEHPDVLTDSDIGPIAWSPDSSVIAFGPRQHGRGIVWRLGEKQHCFEFKPTSYLNALAFQPGTTNLAIGTDKVVQLWDYAQNQKILEIPQGVSGIRSLVWLPDGKTLAMANRTGLRLYDPATQSFTATYPYVNGYLGAFGRDGTQFAWVDHGQMVRTLNLPAGKRGLSWVPRTPDAYLAVSLEGHFWETDNVKRGDIVYLAELESGEQKHFTPAEFAARFDWKNDPAIPRNIHARK